MEDRIDRLFRQQLYDQRSSFDAKAWDRMSLELNPRKKRRFIWVWLLFVLIISGITGYFVLNKLTEKVNQNIEFAEIEKINITNDPDNSVLKKKEDELLNNEKGIAEINKISEAKIFDKNPQNHNENYIPIRTEGNESENMIYLNSNEKNSKVNVDDLISSGLPDNISETVNIDKLSSRATFEINTIARRQIDISYSDILQLNKIVYPIKASPLALAFNLDAGIQSSLGLGFAVDWNNNGGLGLSLGLMYNLLIMDSKLIARETTSYYSFGRTDIQRSFASDHIHSVGIPLHVKYNFSRLNLYSGLRANILAGIRGSITTESEGVTLRQASWLKEYGHNNLNLNFEGGFIYDLNSTVGVGLRLEYLVTSRYNKDYFFDSNIPLPNTNKLNIAIQIQYEIF